MSTWEERVFNVQVFIEHWYNQSINKISELFRANHTGQKLTLKNITLYCNDISCLFTP